MSAVLEVFNLESTRVGNRLDASLALLHEQFDRSSETQWKELDFVVSACQLSRSSLRHLINELIMEAVLKDYRHEEIGRRCGDFLNSLRASDSNDGFARVLRELKAERSELGDAARNIQARIEAVRACAETNSVEAAVEKMSGRLVDFEYSIEAFRRLPNPVRDFFSDEAKREEILRKADLTDCLRWLLCWLSSTISISIKEVEIEREVWTTDAAQVHVEILSEASEPIGKLLLALNDVFSANTSTSSYRHVDLVLTRSALTVLDDFSRRVYKLASTKNHPEFLRCLSTAHFRSTALVREFDHRNSVLLEFAHRLNTQGSLTDVATFGVNESPIHEHIIMVYEYEKNAFIGHHMGCDLMVSAERRQDALDALRQEICDSYLTMRERFIPWHFLRGVADFEETEVYLDLRHTATDACFNIPHAEFISEPPRIG
ncbi:hypothetical protein GYB59_14275 [bacterium]|nr:hypothetical protein [bacterium]